MTWFPLVTLGITACVRLSKADAVGHSDAAAASGCQACAARASTSLVATASWPATIIPSSRCGPAAAGAAAGGIGPTSRLWASRAPSGSGDASDAQARVLRGPPFFVGARHTAPASTSRILCEADSARVISIVAAPPLGGRTILRGTVQGGAGAPVQGNSAVHQRGESVAFGVLLDILVVRSVLVTALTLAAGRCMWWPSALFRRRDAPTRRRRNQFPNQHRGPADAPSPPSRATSPGVRRAQLTITRGRPAKHHQQGLPL